MLVVIDGIKYANYTLGSVADVPVLSYTGPVFILIDPSKTNMAVMICSYYDEIISTIEFSGNGRRKERAMDTTQYCAEVTEYLTAHTKHCDIRRVYMEQNIMKKGMDFYVSSNVLTEIRGALLHYYDSQYNIRIKEINNWSWKADVLPDGYRSQNEKGSKRFIHDYFPDSSLNNYFEADMSDTFCMYLYVKKRIPTSEIPQLVCVQAEAPLNAFNASIMPRDIPTSNARIFNYNAAFTLEENIAYYVNRVKSLGVCELPVSALTLDDIYKYASLFDDVSANIVKVVVKCL